MKKSKFSEEQIAYALRQVESGTPPAGVCRQLGVSEATGRTFDASTVTTAAVRPSSVVNSSSSG